MARAQVSHIEVEQRYCSKCNEHLLFFASISTPLHSTSHSCLPLPATAARPLSVCCSNTLLLLVVKYKILWLTQPLMRWNQSEMKVGTWMKTFKSGPGQLREVPSEPPHGFCSIEAGLLYLGLKQQQLNFAGLFLPLLFSSIYQKLLKMADTWLLCSEQLFQTLSRIREIRKFWVESHSNFPAWSLSTKKKKKIIFFN